MMNTLPEYTPLTSTASGKPVANQGFISWWEDGHMVMVFQSYATRIAKWDRRRGGLVLDAKSWDASSTTARYLRQFLAEQTIGDHVDMTPRQFRAAVESGAIATSDLNG